MAILFGGSGVGSGRTPLTLELQAGSTYIIPSGTWAVDLGPYTTYEVFDQQTATWRVAGAPGARSLWIDSDGNNHRLANTTGCVVGATVTSGGAGYTSAPTVTVNSGGATFTAILGPVVNTITVVNGGSNYTYPPLVLIGTPPNGAGVAASAYSTISAGVVSTVTVTDQGAGFIGTPTVNLVNDPRDSTGAGATATASMTGQGTVAAVLCTNHGTPTGISTAGVLPTLTFAGGGYTTTAAALPVMAWTMTAYTVTSAGTGYVQAAITGFAAASGTPTYTNPTIQAGTCRARPPMIYATVSSNGTFLAASATSSSSLYWDGGVMPYLPTTVILGAPTVSTGTQALVGATVGGINDVAIFKPV